MYERYLLDILMKGLSNESNSTPLPKNLCVDEFG